MANDMLQLNSKVKEFKIQLVIKIDDLIKLSKNLEKIIKELNQIIKWNIQAWKDFKTKLNQLHENRMILKKYSDELENTITNLVNEIKNNNAFTLQEIELEKTKIEVLINNSELLKEELKKESIQLDEQWKKFEIGLNQFQETFQQIKEHFNEVKQELKMLIEIIQKIDFFEKFEQNIIVDDKQLEEAVLIDVGPVDTTVFPWSYINSNQFLQVVPLKTKSHPSEEKSKKMYYY